MVFCVNNGKEHIHNNHLSDTHRLMRCVDVFLIVIDCFNSRFTQTFCSIERKTDLVIGQTDADQINRQCIHLSMFRYFILSIWTKL